MKEAWKRLRWVLFYGVFYLASFYLVEHRTTRTNIIYTKIDDMIPFCKYFIIPYAMWFLFIGVTVAYFAFCVKNQREYYSLIINLGIGMTVFILVSWCYPNGHFLRPFINGNDFFDKAVRFLYRIDTPTNVFPSIHVFNSLVCCTALLKNDRCRRHKSLSATIVLLTALILMSTVLLKQHSMMDVAGAFALFLITYPIAYPRYVRVPEKNRRVRKGSPQETYIQKQE